MRSLPRVALLIESSRTYGRGILRGIARYAHANGPWSVFLQERELHSGIPPWLTRWNGDGIIARIENNRMATKLTRTGRPVVDVLGNNRLADIPGFDSDARALAQLAADYFVRAGFRHFAFFGYRGIPFSDRREAAYATCLAKHGFSLKVFPSKPGRIPAMHIQALEQSGLAAGMAIADWLRKQPRPLAIFACNDVCAQQVLNACREQGIKVPEEIAVMGVDNDDVLCNLCEPSLTSIEPDTERLGYEAATQLDRMMRGRLVKAVITQIPPIRLHERGSTDVLPIDDPVVAQALRFIRSRLAKRVGVKDVLEQASRSRTDMELRFRRWLKTSISKEITRQQLDRAGRLLQQTDLSLKEVASRAGVANASHLCRLFRRRHNRTPTEFRGAVKTDNRIIKSDN